MRDYLWSGKARVGRHPGDDHVVEVCPYPRRASDGARASRVTGTAVRALVRLLEYAQPLQVNPINREQVQGPNEEFRNLLLGRVGTWDIDPKSHG